MPSLPRTLLAAAAAGLALAVSACSGQVPGSDAVSTGSTTIPALTTVHVAALPGGVQPVDFRAAIEEGIYADHGLDIVTDEFTTGTDAIAAAVQGSDQIAYADLFAGISARKNGFDVGLLTPVNTASPFQYFLVPGDSDITSLADLEGKNLAIPAVPQFVTFAHAILAAQEVDPDAVEYTIVKDQSTFGAILESGQVDAVNVSNAVAAYQWINQYGFKLVGDPDVTSLGIAQDTPIAGFWAPTEWYEQNSEVADAFAAATAESHEWYAGLSETERAAHVKKQTTVDLEALDQSSPGVLTDATAYFPFTGAIDQDALQTWIELGAKYASIPADVPLDELLLPSARS